LHAQVVSWQPLHAPLAYLGFVGEEGGHLYIEQGDSSGVEGGKVSCLEGVKVFLRGQKRKEATCSLAGSAASDGRRDACGYGNEFEEVEA
jgi:hypothetical protein